MARAQSRFICQACGAEFLRWEGQCRSCAAWNTLVETVVTARQRDRRAGTSLATRAEVVPLSAAGEAPSARFSTGISELDRVLGGVRRSGLAWDLRQWVGPLRRRLGFSPHTPSLV